MNYLPFNLEIALAHPERVVTRDGCKVLELHFFAKATSEYCLIALLEGEDIYRYTKNGIYSIGKQYTSDLVLLPEAPKYVPFTSNDWELFMGKVVCYGNDKGVIGCSDSEGVTCVGLGFFSFEKAFEKFTFPDGTPFGKEVVNES